MRGLRGTAVLIIVCAVSVSAVPPSAGGPAGGDSDAAVFQLFTMAHEGDRYHAVEAGTAFFIDPDGTALTNSHVVYLARNDPSAFQLLAVIGSEFYGATIVCANALPYAPTDTHPVVFGRDVAEVKVTRSGFLFTRLKWANTDIEYSAHLTELPSFAALALGHDPVIGDKVRVVGFGRITERLIDTPGERWTATGSVSAIRTTPDGTRIFRVVSTNRPRLGNSGSPALDSHGSVVGMWTWNEASNLAFGAAIASSALTPACP